MPEGSSSTKPADGIRTNKNRTIMVRSIDIFSGFRRNYRFADLDNVKVVLERLGNEFLLYVSKRLYFYVNTAPQPRNLAQYASRHVRWVGKKLGIHFIEAVKIRNVRNIHIDFNELLHRRTARFYRSFQIVHRNADLFFKIAAVYFLGYGVEWSLSAAYEQIAHPYSVRVWSSRIWCVDSAKITFLIVCSSLVCQTHCFAAQPSFVRYRFDRSDNRHAEAMQAFRLDPFVVSLIMTKRNRALINFAVVGHQYAGRLAFFTRINSVLADAALRFSPRYGRRA